MEVRVAQNEDVLMGVQYKARDAALPTHTYAGRSPELGKHRSLIVVGPAEHDALHQCIGKLEVLS